MTFSEIEKVLGFPLPASKRYQAWWSNNPWNNVMTKAWLAAGYKTEQIDVGGEKVTFVKDSGATPAPNALQGLAEKAQPSFAPRNADAAKFGQRGRSPLFGSMKGTTIVMPGVDLTEPADPDWGKVYAE